MVERDPVDLLKQAAFAALVAVTVLALSAVSAHAGIKHTVPVTIKADQPTKLIQDLIEIKSVDPQASNALAKPAQPKAYSFGNGLIQNQK